ncbi:transposase, partial [Desulfovibrio sp. OttesenSCG-928-O18]|nr:transposase [Desulfovibrio sp. OttesenSCG-928-O18]
CIIQNINKGIFPGIFTENDCSLCLSFFTNGKFKYFNEDVYSWPIPVLRLMPDRNMSILHAKNLNFKAHYIRKIILKNSDIIAQELLAPKQNAVGRPRSDDLTIFCATLYKFWTATKWEDLSAVYPSINYTRCKKRKSEWSNDGTFRRIRKALRKSPKCQDGKRPSDIRRLSLLLRDL